MTPHYFLLSPLEAWSNYLLLGLQLGSSAICILVSFYFYRVKKEGWWLMVAAVFALQLVMGPALSWHRGIPPFPFALQTVVNPRPAPPGFTGSKIIENKSSSGLDSITIYMAIALTWAYVTEKKKRT